MLTPRHPYKTKRLAVPFATTGDSRTIQSAKKETDINHIVSQYQKTGAITHFARNGAKYGDFSGPEFDQAMLIVAKGQTMFEELPSNIRNRFKTPKEFLEFVQDPKNADEMRSLGLREPVSKAEKEKLEENPRATPGDDPQESATDSTEPKTKKEA